MIPLELPTLADVRAAADRIRGQVLRTPTLHHAAIDELAGAEVYLKAENLQRIGAFKARGAMHTVGRLSEAERAKGVITYSSGNHAQAVALAAKVFGVPAFIAMPTDAPAVKLEAVRALGAEVTLAGTTSEERKVVAERIQRETGGAMIPPFDHPDIIAGAGTATLELLEQVAEQTGGGGLDAIVVPVGGGGLIAGACIASSESRSDAGAATRVFSVEPVGCDALRRSLEAGARVDVSPAKTLADGLKPTRVGELNFEIARRQVRASFLVDDRDLSRALATLLYKVKVLVEPSGAAGLAVALRGDGPRDRSLWPHLDGPPRRIGVLLSGGNVGPDVLTAILSSEGNR